ncbi:MAG: hypothetical protein OXR84_14730 [Magnetovibrio sp.]|nr:hypothetical protein [Magnetovibrio sp.]
MPPEPPAPPDGFDLGFAFDYARELPPVALTEAHRNAVLLFLERALIVLTPAVKSMDEATQFGLHLFLAGGAERFGATVGLKNLQKFVLIREAIGSLGTAPDAIEDFCERFIDYDTDEKYRVMTDVGRDIMEMYLDDNHACFAGLPELFERWTGSPVARARALGITAVMVTDITDALEPDDGEAGVPGVVRGHNGAVRRALAEFHGTELHHTGRGIAALFTDAANAIGAAAMVQRELARHNAGDPVTPLHVRIGIDADAGSDPVAETIDQVTEGAALACAGAEAGEIVVSETALTLGTDDPLAVTGSPRGDPPGSLTAIDWLKEA